MDKTPRKKRRYIYKVIKMAAKPRLYQVADTANSRRFIKDLPKEILLKIITFCSGDNPTMKKVALLFQSIGIVSKQLREYCTVFCKRYPIDLSDTWQGRYRTIQFLCKKKVKLLSISINHVWKDLRPSLFIYLLQECDLSALESVHIELLYYNGEKSPLGQAWDEVMAVAIPREVYELEYFCRTNNTINMSSLQESLKLQVLENVCQIIRKKENRVQIRKLHIFVDNWHQSAANQIVLNILQSGSSLESLKLYADDYLTEPTLEQSEVRSQFFASLEDIIAKIHISYLCLRSQDFNGELRIKSASIQRLEVYMKHCTINEIKCPYLTKLKLGVRYGKSFLSEFSSPMLESCTLVLLESHAQSAMISTFIKMNKSLKRLTLEESIKNLNRIRYTRSPYNLIIESESLEYLNSAPAKRSLSIRSMNCPKLRKFKIPYIFNNEDEWHCPIRSEPVFLQTYKELQRSPIRALLGLPRNAFLGSEFDFQTINIPDDCWLQFSQ